MACCLALSLGCPTLRVENHLPLLGPSSLLHWPPFSWQRSGGVPPPPPPLAARLHLHHRRRHRHRPLAPVLVTRRALAFLFNLR